MSEPSATDPPVAESQKQLLRGAARLIIEAALTKSTLAATILEMTGPIEFAEAAREIRERLSQLLLALGKTP